MRLNSIGFYETTFLNQITALYGTKTGTMRMFAPSSSLSI
ncbi:MAG: hypothetical protein BAJATHORv1_20236 [Candidatus Thorarchaeota archaeon]|nr:MAG: hypothetical protein BAJATHORv1_20236 [Candidatus Thorarchaeota archaeon]